MRKEKVREGRVYPDCQSAVILNKIVIGVNGREGRSVSVEMRRV